MRTEIETRQILLLPCFVAVLILIGIIAGILTRDPELLKRMGASIAAVAAAAILLQIRVEMNIEEERKKLEGEMDRRDLGDAASPMGALELRLETKRFERMQSGLTTARLRVASYVVGCAIVGELLHGFGDVLMCHLFTVCPRCH